MMTSKRLAMLLLCLAALPPATDRSIADEAPCAVVSAGAETDTATGSVQNVGQAMIGRANNGSVFMHAGGIPCFGVHLSCMLGDVDGNGVIDGLDIDDYVRVVLTGIGTPREICAANIDVAPFASLLGAP